MKILFLILFSFSLYAQDVIIIQRGTGAIPPREDITYYLVDKVGNKAMLFKTGTYAIKLKE